MNVRNLLLSLVVCLTGLCATPAQAHFLWLFPSTTDKGGTVVTAHFSEAADDAEPELLDRLNGIKTWHRAAQGEPQELVTERTPDGFVIKSAAGYDLAQPGLIGTEKNFGVIARGEAKFLLQYYAKTYTGKNVDRAALGASKPLRLDVVPVIDGKTLTVTVTWEGKPVANSEVVIKGPGLEGAKQTTDAAGHVTCQLGDSGLLSIRARHIEAKAGQLDGKDYAEIRNFVTLTLSWEKAAAQAAGFAPLPEGLTSFGGAKLGDWLYVYGGNTGTAHEYFMQTQSPHLRRLNLKSGGAWEDLAPGPRLQGVALVACKGQVIRIGGFCAHNAQGEKSNLWSVPDVSAYDPETKSWTNLPPLPAPRSSHDAAVIGDTIYVVGGWQLRGSSKSAWHDNAWSLDLSAENPVWQALPAPNFQRRALSVAALAGKLYVIGGMTTNNKITNEVSVFDPASREWSTAAALPGSGLEGFGTAAFALNDHLVVTTKSGKVWSLQPGATDWKAHEELIYPRFFHRLLPLSAEELVVVGGAGSEKVLELETVSLKP